MGHDVSHNDFRRRLAWAFLTLGKELFLEDELAAGAGSDANGTLSWTPSLVGSASNLFCGPQQHIFKTFCGTVKEKHCCGYCGNRTTKFCGTCEEQGHGVIAVCGRRSGRECITEHQKGTSLSHGSWRSTKPRNGRSNSGPLGADPPVPDDE